MRFIFLFACAAMVMPIGRTSAEGRVYLTRDEARHVGADFIPRDIVARFRKSAAANSPGLAVNDFLEHHNIVRTFCSHLKQKYGKKCSWAEYYAVLDDIRSPYDGYFDPGGKAMIPINNVYDGALPEKLIRSATEESCDIIENPSANDFYELVKASHPTIIKGGAATWPALSKWTLDYLRQEWRERKVVVSISPSGDFDGPENASLWGLDTNESVIIARPAHEQMEFQDFVDTALSSRHENVTYYLEYFPLRTLEKKGDHDIQAIKWANFLSPRFTLVWFGITGVRNPVGRLHYDRHENLMAMVSGSKDFVLFGPDQGEELYASTPVRSGPLIYKRAKANATAVVDNYGETLRNTGIFFREKSRIDDTFNEYHTYSPVDIMSPDFEKYPKFKNAKRKVCTVKKGDIIFVPADWWHQVTSQMDEEGKSIGVNIFFEPFYKKPGYLTLLKDFVQNRYYSHIYDQKSVRPCSDKRVCFRNAKRSKTDLSSTQMQRSFEGGTNPTTKRISAKKKRQK